MRFTPGIVGIGRAAGTVFREPNTNRVTNPEAFNLWSATQAVVTADAIADPEGNMNADTVTDENVGTAGGVTLLNTTATLVASTLHRASVYAKPGTNAWLRLGVVNLTGVATLTHFNVSTGAFGNIGANIADYGMDAAIGGGWRRCWMTFTCGATDLTGNTQVGVAYSGTSLNFPLLDGTHNMHFWLAQLAVV